MVLCKVVLNLNPFLYFGQSSFFLSILIIIFLTYLSTSNYLISADYYLIYFGQIVFVQYSLLTHRDRHDDIFSDANTLWSDFVIFTPIIASLLNAAMFQSRNFISKFEH